MTETVDRRELSTTYTITGLREDVERRVRGLRQQYHPCGYGTSVRWLCREIPDGVATAQVWRMNSCD